MSQSGGLRLALCPSPSTGSEPPEEIKEQGRTSPRTGCSSGFRPLRRALSFACQRGHSELTATCHRWDGFVCVPFTGWGSLLVQDGGGTPGGSRRGPGAAETRVRVCGETLPVGVPNIESQGNMLASERSLGMGTIERGVCVLPNRPFHGEFERTRGVQGRCVLRVSEGLAVRNGQAGDPVLLAHGILSFCPRNSNGKLGKGSPFSAWGMEQRSGCSPREMASCHGTRIRKTWGLCAGAPSPRGTCPSPDRPPPPPRPLSGAL